MTHTAGLILAAGLGRRFGGEKMLASVDGRPMLQHVLDVAAAAKLDPVKVVLGDDAESVAPAMVWGEARHVRNLEPGRGLASSLLVGLAELTESDRVIVLLGDQPYLTVEQVRTILAVERDPERPIVVPRYGGVPGNPVLLEREAFPLAAQLAGDGGMSQLFREHPELVRYLDVQGTNPDIDTPDDLATNDPSALVGQGYDALGDRFAQWSNGIADPMRERLLGAFFGRLPKDADVLDLGCGPGLVWTGDLPRKIRLTGVDLSAVQLRAAQSRVPDGRFIRADMTTIDFSQASFDGVLALYSLNHLPAAAQTQMVETIGHWLRPNGVMLATFPTSGVSAWRGEWLGVPMFFGGQKIEEIRASMARADLEILADEEVDTQEPEGSARFEWILAAKPSRRGGG